MLSELFVMSLGAAVRLLTVSTDKTGTLFVCAGICWWVRLKYIVTGLSEVSSVPSLFSLTASLVQIWSASQKPASEPANCPLLSTSQWKTWTSGSSPLTEAVSKNRPRICHFSPRVNVQLHSPWNVTDLIVNDSSMPFYFFLNNVWP